MTSIYCKKKKFSILCQISREIQKKKKNYTTEDDYTFKWLYTSNNKRSTPPYKI